MKSNFYRRLPRGMPVDLNENIKLKRVGVEEPPNDIIASTGAAIV